MTSDGTVVFYTIDGRRSGHSIGASLSQVAQRMIELGCVAAIGLDGGAPPPSP
ncbi:MAG: phosphodiester glycosidase family protein [Dysosmobacter welbionis]